MQRSASFALRVPPNYAHAVMEALKRNAITPSRAIELMRGQISIGDLPPDDEADEGRWHSESASGRVVG